MKVCISCQQDVAGKRAVRVKEDRIISGIREIKKALKVAQMNELYVCEADLRQHLERRKGFEKGVLFASILAGGIFIILTGSLVLSGRFDLWAIVSSLLLAGFVMALSLFRYAPALEPSQLVAELAPQAPAKAQGGTGFQLPIPGFASQRPKAETQGAKPETRPVQPAAQKKSRSRKR